MPHACALDMLQPALISCVAWCFLLARGAGSERPWTNARHILTRQAMGGTVSGFFSDMVTTVVAYDISSEKCQEALKWTADGTKVPHSANPCRPRSFLPRATAARGPCRATSKLAPGAGSASLSIITMLVARESEAIACQLW